MFKFFGRERGGAELDMAGERIKRGLPENVAFSFERIGSLPSMEQVMTQMEILRNLRTDVESY